jgi:hypothetical protein
MKRTAKTMPVLLVLALPQLLSAPIQVSGQERTLVPPDAIRALLDGKTPAQARPAPGSAVPGGPVHDPNAVYRCKGEVKRVIDAAYEGLKITNFNWSNTSGGGEAGRFDKTPILTSTVTLTDGCTCLNAHLSAMVGSKQTYGQFFPIASITFFQVTLTPVSGGAPIHMTGHFERPYNIYGPAVFIEAERDMDAFAANFFQRVGEEPGDIPAGTYRVDVWWSGGPVGGGGALGVDFVLKLYVH